jgi:DNA-binding NtrC family response regulator
MILKNYFENIDTLLSPKTLESTLKQTDYDVVLLDMNFKAGVTSGNEGIFWMTRIRQVSPQTQVVMQTAYSDIELAVKSIKRVPSTSFQNPGIKRNWWQQSSMPISRHGQEKKTRN